MNYTKIRENIWQIEDDNGVYCTLVNGSKLAILWDTGFGKTELRSFVEENVQTEYMVINSHGHPDHIGGNSQFEVIYAAEAAFDEIEYYTKELSGSPISYDLKALKVGQVLGPGRTSRRGGLTRRSHKGFDRTSHCGGTSAACRGRHESVSVDVQLRSAADQSA